MKATTTSIATTLIHIDDDIVSVLLHSEKAMMMVIIQLYFI
jgi:hypothetical protein